jgi:rod shape determining protein RodA
MSFLEYRVKTAPSGFSKVLALNWALVLVVTAVAAIGWLMLYSISGGRIEIWAEPQMKRYVLGLVVMFIVAFTPIWFWRSMSGFAYACRCSYFWRSSFSALLAWVRSAGSTLASCACNRPN